MSKTESDSAMCLEFRFWNVWHMTTFKNKIHNQIFGLMGQWQDYHLIRVTKCQYEWLLLHTAIFNNIMKASIIFIIYSDNNNRNKSSQKKKQIKRPNPAIDA